MTYDELVELPVTELARRVLLLERELGMANRSGTSSTEAEATGKCRPENPSISRPPTNL